jgi:hypothetical protein
MPNVNESASEYAANCAIGNVSRDGAIALKGSPPCLDESTRMQEPSNHAA